MGWLLASVFCFIGALLSAVVSITQKSFDNIHVVIILSILGVIFLVMKNRSKAKKEEKLRKQQEEKRRITDKGIIHECALQLVEGLPLATATICNIMLNNDTLTITGAEQTYQIKLPQIIVAQTKSEAEVQQETTGGGLGNAMVGGLLFGAVGAVIASRPKTKKTTTFSYFLIINYSNNQNEPTVLSFEGQSLKECQGMSDAIMNSIRPLRENAVTQL